MGTSIAAVMSTPGKNHIIGINETRNVMVEKAPTAPDARRTADTRCGPIVTPPSTLTMREHGMVRGAK